jgi:integrase
MEENDTENERDLLPEIVVDEAAEDYVVMDDELPADLEQEDVEQPPPRAQSAAEEEQSVVLQAEVPPMPEQDNIFQTGRPAKKKRNVSEKQRAHLERIRSKALERKREKAAERRAAKTTDQPAKTADQPAPAAAVQPAAPRVEPIPSPYLTQADVDDILNQYDQRRAKKKEAKRKEQRVQNMVSTHLGGGEEDVWAQCFQ